MRPFNTIDVTNTVGQLVQAFNNNALASSDHTWYLGEIFYNGMLYTGLETIGGEKIKSLTNLAISTKSPQNLEIDNFYLYFRSINKIVLVDGITVDLEAFNDNNPYFVYINSDLGYRVTQEFKQEPDEIRLFRFILREDKVFSECYVVAQRFGTSVYDAGQEFYQILGLEPKALNNVNITLSAGYIQRSGIKFDNHQVPDILTIAENTVGYNIRYNTEVNKVDYSKAPIKQTDTSKILDYANSTFTDLEDGKYTVQRILYDVYENTLVMQYGNKSFDTMESALSSLENTEIPFPYNELGLYIPVGLMFCLKNATDLRDSNQCLLIPHTSTSTSLGASYFFAEDSFARGKIEAMQNSLDTLTQDLLDITSAFNAHAGNYENPHQVTKAQVGLGNVDNLSYEETKTALETDLDPRYVNITGDTMTGPLTVNNIFNTNQAYIIVGGRRFYVGTTPADAPDTSYAIR